MLVAIESTGDVKEVTALGKQLAMHVAAANPVTLSREDVDPSVVEREKSILMEQVRDSGKPQEIIEKMVEGRLRKYYTEICLLEQSFVIDPDKSVGKFIESLSSDLGTSIVVKGFLRYALGEGVEKEEEDFAAEVAAVAGGS